MPRQLPNWIESYLEYTENTESEEIFRKWVAISTIASVMQRKCRLPFGVIDFYPNMYIVLVGPPAACKGTAIAPARQFLDMLGINIAADEASRQKLVQALLDADAVHTDKHGTSYMHCSLTIIASELTVFLGYNNTELLAVLCKWFDCENRFIYDTHKHGWQEVNNVWVNLLGATTPTQIQASMPSAAIGSGFTSRTVFVYDKGGSKCIIVPVLSAEQRLLQPKLHTDIGYIKKMVGDFKYSQEFIEEYGVWRADAQQNPPFRDPRLLFYTQRRKVHILKLSMIYSAACREDMILRLCDFEQARNALHEAEVRMPRVFEGLGGNPLAAVQVQVMREVAEKGRVPMKALMAMFRDEVDTNQMALIIATLEESGWCAMDVVKREVVYKGDQR